MDIFYYSGRGPFVAFVEVTDKYHLSFNDLIVQKQLMMISRCFPYNANANYLSFTKYCWLDISAWLSSQITLWIDFSSPEIISIDVTRYKEVFFNLETDHQLWGEPPAVCVWTREKAGDAEDDVVAVGIVRYAIAIWDHSPIPLLKEVS